ncbi:PHA/PHB synthase family protein [Pseudonocardia sp. H11422]|uniref:PHA/PHB synthase family protein n=1 Tax=Pseudonocardia sp. H11422 TaxID=2835866 RepID=UPI001BDC5E15|nr:alpha/beta fold hydrolase [Pseudonocardia sp. H11422]
MTAESAAAGAPAHDQPDDDVATGLDMLLTDGALGPLRRMVPAASGLRLAASLATKPTSLLRRGVGFATELGKIGLGRSELAPDPEDRRFADPAWRDNGLLRRIVQTHIAATGTATDLVDDAELDRVDAERVRFAVSHVADALAPSNNPVLNPLAWRAAIDTRGRSAVEGLRRLVTDLSSPPRVPSMVEPDAFEVGEDLAATPGAVVLRTPVFELLQYLPQTREVRDVPLLMVPPTINKYYVADLAPGRSIVEHLVQGGQQVFLISWRNPDAEHADWDLDTYGQAVLDAMDACERITRVNRTALMGFCSGGMITAMLLAHLAAIGQQDRVAAVAFAATVLDQDKVDTTGALLDEATARAATEASAANGYLDGRTLAEVFAWLRPNDLIWNYWVNNYLQGKPPEPVDILYWNADTTRMTAGLHRDLIDIALTNALVTPGAANVLGTPVDLSKIDRDAYVIAGIADRQCTWQSCYRTTQLVGGKSRFVLSTSGHIASVVNPPGNPEAGFRVTAEPIAPGGPADAKTWLDAADTETGSWWPDLLDWLGERSGGLRDAPPELGGRGLHAVHPAPGEYVYAR